ncbi:MAG: hypothetical protein H6559_26680 [Lewinellaceae bacterium]|nr:hypothetical protein [Lewinellaceae bacterium]
MHSSSKAGNEYSLLSDHQYQVFLGVSILSMALSTYLIKTAPTLAHKTVSLPVFSTLVPTTLVLSAASETDDDLSGHLVIIGYGVCGKQIAYDTNQQRAPFHIIELDEIPE